MNKGTPRLVKIGEGTGVLNGDGILGGCLDKTGCPMLMAMRGRVGNRPKVNNEVGKSKSNGFGEGLDK